jgi:hypothetical protein
MLQQSERLSRLRRYVFVQVPDDYTSVLRHPGVPAAARGAMAGLRFARSGRRVIGRAEVRHRLFRRAAGG